jgi:hypothetical protein
MAAEVHVQDLGTTYRVRVKDEGADFDPSAASVKKLLFLMPGNDVVLEKDAAVEVGSGAEVGQWFLTYEVGADEGSPEDEFHQNAGRFKVQGYLEWADGTKYHSNVQTLDKDGNELRVHRNLA